MAESLFLPGHDEARERVRQMSRAELLAYLDMLYGRDALDDDASDDDVRNEALSQCDVEFTP